MASKFMVDSAFKARLLLQPSHRRTVSPGIIYKLGCPITGRPMWPLVLGSKAYSGSSPTPPLPKDQSLQSSRYKDKDRDRIPRWLKSTTALLATGGISLLGYATKEFWFPDWYKELRRVGHESARESAILEKLKKGPEFRVNIEAAVLRENLLEEVKMHITATERSRLYPLIIGEHGTGKTSLIQLVIKNMDRDKPKGIAYVDLPVKCRSEIDIVNAIRKGLGWNPDPAIDSDKPASVEETLEFFSCIALKYQQKYKQVPVLIIDNINRLSENKQEFLDIFQDYAKLATDQGIATFVFVSSEGRVPRRMTERSSWSRRGRIIEVDDMSQEEAFQFLKLRKLDQKLATQAYELAGGRIIHLKSITDAIKVQGNHIFPVIRREMFSMAKGELQNANLLPGHRYHKEGAVIIRELLKKESISENTYYNLIDVYLGRELLETNVFALHLNSGEVTFQSTIMKRFCEENSALWKGK